MSDRIGDLSGDDNGPAIARWLAGFYAALILLGAVALRLPGATIKGNEFSLERAVFTSVNAATLTGFQQSVAVDQYARMGQWTILLLMSGGTVLTLIIGGIALSRLLRLPYDAGTIIRGTLFSVIFALSIGSSLLLERARTLFPSIFQAASAFGNSGHSLGPLPAATDWRAHAALMPLAWIGGLGIPVILELADSIFKRQPLSKHTRVVLSLMAAMYLIGVLLLSPWGMRGEDGSLDLAGTLASGSVFSINSRTCGLPLASPSSLSRVSQWLLMVFMMIGAAPAGSGGGMKVTALYHAWQEKRRALRREPGLRINGIAGAWMIIYLAMLLATFLGLLASMPETSADRLALLASSAVGNVGLSNEPLSVTGPGLLTLVIAMIAGRAAPLMLLWWAAATTQDAEVGV